MENKGKVYNVQILGPTGIIASHTVEADLIYAEGESIVCKNQKETIGIYPSRYTMIQLIREL